MNDAQLIQTILTRSLETLEIIKVVLDDKLAGLRGDENVSTHNKMQAEKVFEHFSQEKMLDIAKKRPGKIADPNSIFQRVQQAVKQILGGGDTVHYKDLLGEIAATTCIDPKAIRTAAYQIKGIKREYGNWSLIAPVRCPSTARLTPEVFAMSELN